MAPVPETQDLALPRIDAGALARRAALPLAAAAAVALALVVAGDPLRAFAAALERALDADARWVVVAAGFEIASFAGYTMLLWLVGSRASGRIGPRESLEITLGGAAATRMLPTAGVGGAALTLWALRRSGLPTRVAARTLLGFLVVLYSVFLASIAVSGALLSFGLAQGDAPLALTALPAAAAGGAIVLALVLAARTPRDGAAAPVPGLADAPVLAVAAAGPVAARVRAGAEVIGGAVRDALGLVRRPDPRLLGALAWWGFDAAVLWGMLHAFGAPPALAVVVLAYFVGQVGNTVPIPGAVSGGIVGILLAFGVPADLALVSVLAYRAVAIWIPVPIGLVALGSLRRTLARWRAEDADAAPAPAPAPARPPLLPPAPARQPVLVATQTARRRGRPCPEPAPVGVAG